MTALWSQCQTGFIVREEEVDCGAFDYWCTVPNIWGRQLITTVKHKECWAEQMFKVCLSVGSLVYFKPTWLFVGLRVDTLSCGAGQWEWARCLLDMGKWVKFQAFSYIWSHTVSGLSPLQLILHLVCVCEIPLPSPLAMEKQFNWI